MLNVGQRHTREPSWPGLVLDIGNDAHGIKQMLAMGRIFDVGVNEKGVNALP